MRSRPVAPVVLALPALALAVAGLFHPHDLTVATSARWWHLHVPGLVVFPLVGLALALLVRGRHDPVAWIVRLAAYCYACFYTALDVIDGIGAGYLTHATPDVPRSVNGADRLFELGHPYEAIGSWALIVACAAVAVDQVLRRSWAGVPSLALLPGAWLVHTDHIFSPYGTTGMLLIGLATAWAATEAPELGDRFVQPGGFSARRTG